MRRLPDYSGEFDPASEDPTELRQLISIRETQLGEYLDRSEALQSEVGELSTRYQQAESARAGAEATASALSQQVERQTAELGQVRSTVAEREAVLRDQQAELGRLRSVGEEVVDLRNTRDQLRGELEDTRARYDARLGDAVREALEQEQRAHDEATAGLRNERDQLKGTVEELRREVGAAGEVRTTEPQTLANRFADVLAELAEREPRPGERFAVNLASMEIEARGVLRAPAEEGQAPEFVTVAPGAVDPGQLSTMRMEFRVTPPAPGSPRPSLE